MTNINRQPIGWHLKSLDEIGRFSSGGTPSKENASFWNGEIPWLSAKDLKSFYLRDSILRITSSAVESGARLVQPGTILILVRGMTLLKDVPVGVATVPMAFNQDIRAFRAHESCDPAFIAYALVSRKTQLMSLVNVAGHGTGRLATELLQGLPLSVPSDRKEQCRISGILSAWDRCIRSTECLIVAKTRLKQSIVQQTLHSQAKCFSERKLGEVFKHRKRKGTDGLPTYSVTMDKGLVLRDALERKNDTSLRPEEHLLIEKDDIAYNMMRMWQGASGLASESGLVSPAYVVLRSRGDVDPLFASYWFKTPRVIKKFRDYSHGLTKDRLRLYYKDFASIALPVPPLELQRKIARTLAACDRELDLLRRKLDLLKQQKQGLMQQLLTGKVRVKVPEGVA